jgi:hypothetical protein
MTMMAAAATTGDFGLAKANNGDNNNKRIRPR